MVRSAKKERLRTGGSKEKVLSRMLKGTLRCSWKGIEVAKMWRFGKHALDMCSRGPPR